MRYVEFNGIRFSSEHGPYIYNRFSPNSGTTRVSSHTPALGDGAIVSGIYYDPRTIAISGSVFGDAEEEYYRAKQALSNACNGKTHTTLYYFNGFEKYEAMAVASIPEYGENEGFCCDFNVNFTLYDFYWYESGEIVIPIYVRENAFENTFTLPCVFTKRIFSGVAYNHLSYREYPNIKLFIPYATTLDFEIKNEATGECFSVSGYEAGHEETLDINVTELTAVSNTGKNILEYCSDFENFYLEPGENNIIIVKNTNNSVVSVSVRYKKRMVGV